MNLEVSSCGVNKFPNEDDSLKLYKEALQSSTLGRLKDDRKKRRPRGATSAERFRWIGTGRSICMALRSETDNSPSSSP